jgi:hypothetical protein
VPTHIDEMVCHVHYKGAGALALHDLLGKEIMEAETEEDRRHIEEAAYLSWPFNCTREWWKVTSGITSIEVLQWKEEMAELRKAHERRAEINAVERSAKKMGLVHSLHYLNGEAGGANYVEMRGLDDKQR